MLDCLATAYLFHAGEQISGATCNYIANFLTENYNKNEDVTPTFSWDRLISPTLILPTLDLPTKKKFVSFRLHNKQVRNYKVQKSQSRNMITD